jgi:DNA repair exonuclease SbcCD ATPase subunit
VVVIDPDGNEADYADGCSGGEQTRIGLALRIALARLLAHRRGADSGCSPSTSRPTSTRPA